MEWLALAGQREKKMHICMDCADAVYRAMDDILKSYEKLTIAALISSDLENGKSMLFTSDGKLAGANKGNEIEGTKDMGDAETVHKAEDIWVSGLRTPQGVFEQLIQSVVSQEHSKQVIAVALYNY